MQPPLPIGPRAWKDFVQDLESAMGTELPSEAYHGLSDLEEVSNYMHANAQQGHLARSVIDLELRLVVANTLGIDPDKIADEVRMEDLMPHRDRRKQLQRIQSETDWLLPKLGMPIWGQQLYGFALLAVFILQFFYPLVGVGTFILGIILLYRVERWSWAFQYPTWLKWIDRIVVLNWPAIQVAAIQPDQTRMLVVDLLQRQLPMEWMPGDPLPTLVIGPDWPSDEQQCHVTNGDALREKIEAMGTRAEIITMRECLCMGPVADTPDFVERRAAFVADAFEASSEKYHRWVLEELRRLADVPAETELNLWFESDLFCQVNLWFLMAKLQSLGRRGPVYLVQPRPESGWLGFGSHDASDLVEAFRHRHLLEPSSLTLGAQLWQAYQAQEASQLRSLASQAPPFWQGITTAVEAHLARDEKPKAILRAALEQGLSDFDAIFQQFQTLAPEYGYGDAQVKLLLQEINAS